MLPPAISTDLLILPIVQPLSPAVLADTDEIIFSSYLLGTPTNVSRLNLGTGEVTLVPINPKIGQTAGSTLYTDGQVSRDHTAVHLEALPAHLLPLGSIVPVEMAASGPETCHPQVAFATNGDAFDDANPPSLALVDPYGGNTTILLNNFFGIRYNGFNDVQALSDGYASAQSLLFPVLKPLPGTALLISLLTCICCLLPDATAKKG